MAPFYLTRQPRYIAPHRSTLHPCNLLPWREPCSLLALLPDHWCPVAPHRQDAQEFANRCLLVPLAAASPLQGGAMSFAFCFPKISDLAPLIRWQPTAFNAPLCVEERHIHKKRVPVQTELSNCVSKDEKYQRRVTEWYSRGTLASSSCQIFPDTSILLKKYSDKIVFCLVKEKFRIHKWRVTPQTQMNANR